MRHCARLLLILLACPVSAQQLAGNLTLTHNHHFQGFRQNTDEPSLHGTVQFSSGDFTAGAWAGRYDLPGSYRSSPELDLFVSYNKSLGLRHQLESSLWHYSYTDDSLDDYSWSQWLTRYQFDGWLTLTMGVSDNLLKTSDPVMLFEALGSLPVRNDTSVSLAIGTNHIDHPYIESFDYATIKVSYQWGPWQFDADATVNNADSGATRTWTHRGFSTSLTYVLDH